ncbi:MAG: hypothetical protein JWN24_2942 [Phycisphaerales bacterium]|nr:hypothetical protein [Phycisphaerales bacterium]
MVRFRCIHCKERLAVHGRHMGRLARCPECGGVTHPLAEHLLAPARSTRGITQLHSTVPDCANCGQPLGKLEKPQQWEGHVVCGPCRRTLADQAAGITHVTTLPIRGGDRLLLQDESGRTPRPSTVLVNAREATPARLPTSIAIDLRTLVGLLVASVLAATTIYLVITIIHSISVVITWATVGIFALLIAYGFRRAIRTIRRRLGALRPATDALPVRAVVRG